jgi:hypothetical protein
MNVARARHLQHRASAQVTSMRGDEAVEPARHLPKRRFRPPIIERGVPVKHDTKPRKTCVLFTFSGLYGANPYNPWVIRGSPV